MSMGQQTNMSSTNGFPHQPQQQNVQQQQQHAKKGGRGTEYRNFAMASIKSELQSYELTPQQNPPDIDEDVSRRIFVQQTNNEHQDYDNVVMESGSVAPPALPPRNRGVAKDPPRVPDHPHNFNVISKGNHGKEMPPPPPPRNNNNPPPTPPRGTTPPPLPPTSSNQKNMNPPPLLRRMSPVPVNIVNQSNQRGTSPVTTGQQPFRIPNSREIQQKANQQLQSFNSAQTRSIFPDGNEQPPAPYPMGTIAAGSNPPPSYSQSLAMRQSPTPSTSSSDYRRSPAPNLLPSYAGPVNNFTPTSPMPVCSSPAYSIGSTSSRASSMQPCAARQTKTQSPVIMQSVSSVRVQKPVLQTAVGVDKESSSKPPPSYEYSIQHKQQILPPPSPSVMSTDSSNSPAPPPGPSSVMRGVSPASMTGPTSSGPPPGVDKLPVPQPPPYPSSHVVAKDKKVANMVNATQVSPKQGRDVIKRANVVSNRNDVKLSVQRRNSPMFDNPSNFHTESPTSDSPHSFLSSGPASDSQSDNTNSTISPMTDSGMVPDLANTTHHTSPKPERRQLSPEHEITRRQSMIRYCPSHAYKFFMEQKIENVMKEYQERINRRMDEERKLIKYHEDVRCERLRNLFEMETNYLRLKRAKMYKNDFKKLKKIGEGAFGAVYLVKGKDCLSSVYIGNSDHAIKGQGSYLYAMKTLKKSHVVSKNQVAHVIAEKDILSEAESDWIVKLFYSFQDSENLYFVMEYIPGGDLMTLLNKIPVFKEDMARFYIAELVCAVESVHNLGFIHRDIKPDNILIDHDGHIKLTDFGLCTGFRWTHESKQYSNNGVHHNRQDSMDPGNLDLDSGNCTCSHIARIGGIKPLERRKMNVRCSAHSLVGTPNYIAPEVLDRNLSTGYSQSCDWWSVGVILFEMIIGRPPFCRIYPDDEVETPDKIRNWKKYFFIPDVPATEEPTIPRKSKKSMSEEAKKTGISKAARDLICGLITSADQRLGSREGSKELKSHEFFRGIDFSEPIRKKKAPYIPTIVDALDTSNFEQYPDDELMKEDDTKEHNYEFSHHGFYNFTFRRFFSDSLSYHRMQMMQNNTNSDGGSFGNSKNNGTANNCNPPNPVYV